MVVSVSAQRPALFPLVGTSAHLYFAQVDKVAFGWSQENGKQEAQFHIQKVGSVRGWAVVESWPLTEQGWVDAWAFMLTKHPELSAKVSATVGHEQRRSFVAAHGAAMREAREQQGELGALVNCVLLGGYGVEDGAGAGDRVDLRFTREQIWLTKHRGNMPYLRVDYADARALEFEGGVVRSGGGWVGGGFGILGAAEGVAMASLLNALTAKTTVQTSVRFEAATAELFLFTDSATPKALEMRFAEIRAKVRAGAAGAAATAPSLTPALPPAARDGDWSERLLRLGEMHEKGLLTAQEFAAAKAKLLG